MKRMAPMLAMILAGCHTVPVNTVADSLDKKLPNLPGATINQPFSALMPKRETGAEAFLKAHPEYDGRGVVVAVFDTGVDPGAPGLQTTPDGRPKIVDVVDGSGSGDINTSSVHELKDGKLTGLTGRALTLPKQWKSRDGKYRLGLAEAYRLFPADLVSRLKSKRREQWDITQRNRRTELEQALKDWDKANSKPDKETFADREELEAQLATLKALQGSYRDPGPLYDCVVFHDDTHWQAAVDTDEDGDFADEKLMTNYRVKRDYGTFDGEAQLNFATNIYREGDLLSLVVDCGAHGTHVAGIVAAHFPDQPELNGIAPGAQIVSVKIGDTRLGSSSTGTGAMRGLIAVLQNKCDLINMSYGGAAPRPDVGRIYQEYSQIVNRHGVIFVSSAGNNGPALSSVGSPGGTTSALLGIGASVTPQMMLDQYGMREARPDMQFTWSSRGPTLDGDLGVDLTAPGGAIAPVPNWQLRRTTQMNGTSMSSPSACGSIALLLSGLKQEKQNHTPHRVRRALENTAVPIADLTPLEQGRGMIRVDKAYDWLKNHPPLSESDLRFEARVSSRNNARGIYLREPFEINRTHSLSVTLSPRFHRDAAKTEQIEFEQRLQFQCDAPWVEHASQVLLANSARRINVKVDPTQLEAGLHYAELTGTDPAHPVRGPLVRLPITVVIPEQPEGHTWKSAITLKKGESTRRFLTVPAGATWADLHIKTRSAADPQRLVLHTLQILPGLSFRSGDERMYLSLTEGQERVESFAVTDGRTLELCFAQYWSSLGEAELELSLQFHGLRPSNRILSLDGNDLVKSFTVTAPLRDERLSPSGTLKTWRRYVRPSKSEINPLDPVRDQLPDNKQIHEMILTYTIDQPATGRVTPILSMKNNSGANYFLESGIWQVFDSAKRHLASGGRGKALSLSKAKYTLRYHVRHPERSVLERYQHSPLILDQPLSKSISLSFHQHAEGALKDTAGFSASTLKQGDAANIFVSIPAHSRLPSTAKPGDLLRGEISLGGNIDDLNGAGKKPGGYSVTLTVPAAKNTFPSNKPKPAPVKKKETPKTNAQEKLQEEIRDLKIAKLKTLAPDKDKDSELATQLHADLKKDHADHLPLHLAWLAHQQKGELTKRADAVRKAIEMVQKQVDLDGLQQHLGTPPDPEAEDRDERKKKWDTQKSALITALRASAQLDLAVAEASKEKERPKAIETFDASWKQLIRWSPAEEAANADLRLDREKLHNRYGNALKLVNAQISKAPRTKKHYETRLKLLEKLGWNEWQKHQKQDLLVRFPAEYPPF